MPILCSRPYMGNWRPAGHMRPPPWPSGYCHDTDISVDLQTQLTFIMNLKAKLVALNE